MEKKKEVKNETVDLTKVKKELKEYVDSSIGDKLKEEATKIREQYSDEIEKANKKLIKEKNKKIFRKNIVIVILILLVGFLTYLLYSNNYFDKYFNHETKTTTKEKVEEKNEEVEVIEEHLPTLDEQIENYGYLLDNIRISENSTYIQDYYNANLADELKKYLVLNTYDFESIPQEEDYNLINEEEFINNYNNLFEEYNRGNFEYNDNKIRFISSLNSYMSTSILEKEESNIQRQIIDITTSEEEITITTIEGIVKEDKLYNVLNSKEIKNYKNDDLSNYENKLNKVTYVFKDNKLVELR